MAKICSVMCEVITVIKSTDEKIESREDHCNQKLWLDYRSLYLVFIKEILFND